MINLLGKLKDPPKGAPEGAERVNFQKIIDLLSFTDGDKSIDQEMLRNTIPKQTYIAWINSVIENDNELKENIKIEENKDSEFIKRMYTSEEPKYKITIENLNFTVMGGLQNKALHPSYSAFKYIIFKNNTFSYNLPNENFPAPESKGFIKISNYCGMKFENNIFKNIKIELDRGDNSISSRFVIIKNNIIPIIATPIRGPLFFEGRNVIDSIDITDKDTMNNKFGVSWTQHQTIDPAGKFAIPNKKTFISLKEIAVKENDKVQEMILSREILKCDRILLKSDGGTAQDNLIMWFGEWSSNHGISLALPIWRLLLINLLFALSTLLIAEYGKYCLIDTWQLLNIWAQMLNPLSSLANTTGIDGNFIISIINALQKGVFAVLVYELIRVGRRFTPK